MLFPVRSRFLLSKIRYQDKINIANALQSIPIFFYAWKVSKSEKSSTNTELNAYM